MAARPVPTARGAALLLFGVLFWVVSLRFAEAAAWALGFDAVVALLMVVDWFLTPGPDATATARGFDPLRSLAPPANVVLHIEARARTALRGEVRDEVPPGLLPEGHRQAFALPDAAILNLSYRLTPQKRG